MPDSETVLKRLVLDFYRSELQSRYQIKNVRRFSDFDRIADSDIEALREFFLDKIYPPVQQRDQLDAALNHLGEVLRSPRRVKPLLGAAISSLWRLGRRLPAAVGAGRSTLDAYRETRKLEAHLLANAIALGMKPSQAKQRSEMILLLAHVPEEDVYRLIRDIMQLFHALSNVPLLETAVEFMRVCSDVIESRDDLYTQEDLDGFRLGLDLVQGGLDLFRRLPPEDFPHIISGIEQVEHDWYARAKEEAAARSGSPQQ